MAITRRLPMPGIEVADEIHGLGSRLTRGGGEGIEHREQARLLGREQFDAGRLELVDARRDADEDADGGANGCESDPEIHSIDIVILEVRDGEQSHDQHGGQHIKADHECDRERGACGERRGVHG